MLGKEARREALPADRRLRPRESPLRSLAAGPCLRCANIVARDIRLEDRARLSFCHDRTGPAGLRAPARLPYRPAPVPLLGRAAGRGGREHPGPAGGWPRAPPPPPRAPPRGGPPAPWWSAPPARSS